MQSEAKMNEDIFCIIKVVAPHVGETDSRLECMVDHTTVPLQPSKSHFYGRRRIVTVYVRRAMKEGVYGKGEEEKGQ